MLFLAIWIMLGVAAAMVAQSRGGNVAVWMFAGILLGPLAFIGLLDVGSPCPHCRSRIHEKATRCPKCGGEIVR